jgi:adenylosuccinate synthase
MTKADVLSAFSEIKVGVGYMYRGKEIDYLPYDVNEEDLEPVYETLPGWNEDLTGLADEADFPPALQSYIDYLEKALETPITVVSVGPDRKQTIVRQEVPA